MPRIWHTLPPDHPLPMVLIRSFHESCPPQGLSWKLLCSWFLVNFHPHSRWLPLPFPLFLFITSPIGHYFHLPFFFHSYFHLPLPLPFLTISLWTVFLLSPLIIEFFSLFLFTGPIFELKPYQNLSVTFPFPLPFFLFLHFHWSSSYINASHPYPFSLQLYRQRYYIPPELL